ncbi:hydroxyethylthiazole kinase [Butyrivibrio sp. X503]|uniref:hydroxyethylthiazole kinase n=1 Tax=Butyrivibrio sp. X503 TaxID=2364878 RepID=UPI000EA8AAF2|nr:hydroxyethylthiazole kinase [Butyrivibrio sp. X503]RKM58179.1 hydroxyethylthiazole kinase [Butyrivibrio sp. X503]
MGLDICKKLKEQSPLIHCITNPISIMQCANAVLLLGARPIMAEHPDEVCDITASAKALLLNFGNITRDRLEAIKLSYDEAMKKEIPIVIDAVGDACSELRRATVNELLGKRNPKVPLLIKGNYSEIRALLDETYKSSGVDADKKLTFEEILDMAKELARKQGVTVLASGEKDIVTDGAKTALIENGTKKLGSITGTGCMLGAVCASFFSIDTSIDSIINATAGFGISGENAKGDMFLMRLFDAIAEIDDDIIEERKKVTWV